MFIDVIIVWFCNLVSCLGEITIFYRNSNVGFRLLAFLLNKFLIIHFQLLLTRTGSSFMPDFAHVDTNNLH